MSRARACAFVAILPFLLALASCGGGGGSSNGGGVTYSVSGAVSGYSGIGLVLRLRGSGPTLALNSGATTFGFSGVSSGSDYQISVATQPSSPSQTCTVTSGSGTVNDADITNVQVSCATNTYTISGSVSGLVGAGLVLQNNGADELPVSSTHFTFGTPVADGGPYNVTVLTQPAGQTCTVANAGGTIAGANVTNVLVSCANNPPPGGSFSIGGSISGLTGNGLVLQNNGGDNLSINAAAAGTAFTFNTPLADGSAYSVTVLAQPSGQTCTVSGGQNGTGGGNVAGGNVTSVLVTCADIPTFSIGGLVSGLASTGTGLVLQNNLGDNRSISGNGPFSFATRLASGSPYSVTILAQPVAHTCMVAGGSGTMPSANVTSVHVSCVPRRFAISGSVSGLIAGRLLVLQNNLTGNRIISGNGAFTFNTAVASGSTYSVTVLTQPTGQTCTVGGGSGTVTTAPVNSVQVSCVANSYTIGGTVAGLSGTGLVLQNSGAGDLPINANGPFAFAAPVLSGNTYSVTVLSSPTSPVQTCTVVSGSGTVAGTNIENVQVNCANDPTYTIGGSVTGLTGTGLVLQNNGADNLSIGAGANSFTFATELLSSLAYNVTILTQPADQTCMVANGSGTVASTNVTNVAVTCVNNTFSVGGSVTGLTGTGLVLQNNGADNSAISADGAFAFTTLVAIGDPYSVSVLTQPSGQTCTIANGDGTMPGANVTNVLVTCVVNTYTISGNGVSGSGVSGLIAGRLLVLQNNLADNLAITADGAFAFNTGVATGLPYSVTILTQPVGQTCSVANGSGTVASADITDVGVSCVVNTYTISGNVSGPLSGLPLPTPVTLLLTTLPNVTQNLVVNAYGPFTFGTPVASGLPYSVSIQLQPSPWICVTTSNAGTVLGANITDIQVSCSDSVVEDTGTQSPLSFPRSHHSATLLANGKVLIAGGYGASLSNPLTSAATFDPDLPGNGGFVDTPGSMGTARASHTATPFAGGAKVLIAGGSDGSAGIGTAEIFDSGTNLFAPTGSMTTLRTDHAAALLQGDKVLITGGWGNGGLPTSSAEIFDPTAGGGAGAFALTGAMTTPRFDHSATTLADGKVLIAGGRDTMAQSLATAEIFDPAANAGVGAFTATGAMMTARRGHTATFLPAQNVVLIVGGETTSNNPTASVEIYDPVTGAFRATGSLTVPRRNHRATLLANGKVLITGGFSVSNGTALATSETYDPTSGLFSNTGSIGAQRADHSATLLPAPNKVLIVGGSPDGTSVVGTAHLFVPQ